MAHVVSRRAVLLGSAGLLAASPQVAGRRTAAAANRLQSYNDPVSDATGRADATLRVTS